MSDIMKAGGGHEEELTDAQLDSVSGGNKDMHLTKTVDSPSPNLFLGTTSAPPPPPPKKA